MSGNGYNKVCIACGAQYKYCPGCRGAKAETMWKNIYCSENCRQIFNTVTGYNMGTVSKEEGKKKLEQCDLSYIDKLKSGLVLKINEILATEESEESSEMKSQPESDNAAIDVEAVVDLVDIESAEAEQNKIVDEDIYNKEETHSKYKNFTKKKHRR